MKRYKLSTIADLNTLTLSAQTVMPIIRYLDTSSITENLIEGFQTISRAEAPSRAKRRVKDNTIIYSTVRPRLKHYGIFHQPDKNLIVSTGFVTIDIKDSYKEKIDPYYLYCMLTKAEITEYLGTIADTAVTSYPSINPSDIEGLEFDFPNIDEQRKAAAILRSIDDKIEHNNLLCERLENTARELFDYYFNNTFFEKSSDNGWERKNILQLCEATRGVTYSKDELLPDSTGGILVLRGNNIQNDSIVFDSNVAFVSPSLVSSEQHIYANDILITMSSGSKEHLGKCAMFHYDSPHTYGSFLSKFSPKGDYAHFVWGIISSDFFKQSIKKMSNGTGINNLSADILERIYFWFPPETIMKGFEFAASPLYNQMGILEQENICLKEEKQRLLSLLLSGTLSAD